jgi:hypothetical protein
MVMDDDSALALGIGCDDGSYCYPVDAGAIGDTVAGGLWGIVGEEGQE